MIRYGFLFSGFKPEYYYFELGVMFRKILVIFLCTFFKKVSNEVQVYTSLLLLISFPFIIDYFKPY